MHHPKLLALDNGANEKVHTVLDIRKKEGKKEKKKEEEKKKR
jgi:hypothetical protein